MDSLVARRDKCPLGFSWGSRGPLFPGRGAGITSWDGAAPGALSFWLEKGKRCASRAKQCQGHCVRAAATYGFLRCHRVYQKHSAMLIQDIARRPLSRLELPDLRHVRFGSKADIAASQTNVRFTPKSGHSALRKGHRYLIISSARCESYREFETGAGRVSFAAVRISSLAAR